MKPEKMIELLKGMQSPLEDYAELVGAPAFTYGHKYVYPYPEDYAIEEAIKALEEVQQYRKIGTVEECKKAVKEEDALKFYYCESEDDYYIGKRVGNFYYARYVETGFEWFMSRYLPWGEHVIATNTVWKEYTYPSEPKEIPFFEWLQGFIKRYCGGTVEECREALEKQRSKILEFYGSREDGKLLCQNCGEDLWDLRECGFNNCPYCGQAILWENLEGMEDERDKVEAVPVLRK